MTPSPEIVVYDLETRIADLAILEEMVGVELQPSLREMVCTQGIFHLDRQAGSSTAIALRALSNLLKPASTTVVLTETSDKDLHGRSLFNELLNKCPRAFRTSVSREGGLFRSKYTGARVKYQVFTDFQSLRGYTNHNTTFLRDGHFSHDTNTARFFSRAGTDNTWLRTS